MGIDKNEISEGILFCNVNSLSGKIAKMFLAYQITSFIDSISQKKKCTFNIQ